MRGGAERQANMLLAVTPDSFIPEEHPIRRIKPIVESAAADRARLGGARLKVCSAHPEPQVVRPLGPPRSPGCQCRPCPCRCNQPELGVDLLFSCECAARTNS